MGADFTLWAVSSAVAKKVLSEAMDMYAKEVMKKIHRPSEME